MLCEGALSAIMCVDALDVVYFADVKMFSSNL